MIDYVFLDKDERLNYYNNKHMYLVDVLEFDNEKNIFNSNEKIKLGYSGLVKELFIFGYLD